MKTLLVILSFTCLLSAQVKFDDYFLDKTLRIDYYHTGDHETDSYSIDELIIEPYWGGSKVKLIDKFNYGSYKFMVFDEKENKLIYSRTYSTLFQEWQTTAEAKTTVKSFSESVVLPYPKNKVRVEFYSRDKENIFQKKFTYSVDPENYFIKPERRHEYEYFDIHISGNPSQKVDIVFLPEGYTSDQLDLFKEDSEKFAGYLFNSSPFKENMDKFNIRCVLAPSEEMGTDIPAKNIWKKTILNSSFYTFDLNRYLMTSDNKTVRDLAANAPYDQIYIIVITDAYGGGAIYNHYSVCTSSNKFSEYVFIHEFGHAFASLGDEYFDSSVAYEEFYPLHLEPPDPNLTTLVDFDSKWKHLVDESIPIPTPNDSAFADKVGVFEGGGYVTKGVYRPMLNCTMRSISVDNFCVVCKEAIQKMINFYSE